MGIPERLKTERERKQLTQTELAAAIKSTKRSVINWEGGAAVPPASAIGAMDALGIDVLYILTGRRSQAVAEVDLLPEGDRTLLANFHAAPSQVQAGIKTTLGAFTPAPGAVKGRGRAA